MGESENLSDEERAERRAARRAARRARRAQHPHESEATRMMRAIVPSLIETTSTAIEEAGPLKGFHIAVPKVDDRSTRIDVWLHPADDPGRPLVVDLHGGGFAMGDSRQNDALCEWERDSWNVNVASVAYRLAPQHPFPAAIGDVNDVMRWFRDFGRLIEIDTAHIYVVGYSAGANLAVTSAMAAARRGAPMPQGLVLHYPFFDAATDPGTRPYRDIDLSVDVMRAFNSWYVGQNDPKDPLISPVYATAQDLAPLPPMSILPVVGDALYDEALAFAGNARAAGVTCEVHPIEGAYHGYVEDAANTAVYEAISVPEQVDARPGDYRRLAARAVAGGLADFLGDPLHRYAFPGGFELERGDDGLMHIAGKE